jgi:hypothetical protein
MANKAEAILSLLGVTVGEEMTAEKINEVFRNFKEVKKTLEDYEKKTLKPFLFMGAEKLGTQTESGGHKVVLEDGTGWEKQARVKVIVDQDSALNLLEKKNLHEFIDRKEFVSEEDMEKVINLLKGIERNDLISSSSSVTDKSLEQAYYQGFIDDEELSELISRQVTYALVEVKPAKKK